MKHFIKYNDFDTSQLNFTLGVDRNGKTTIAMTYGPGAAEVAIITAPAVTMWPRCTGDGNFGTMWGPTDPQKAKFTLDLIDNEINGNRNDFFAEFLAKVTEIDEKLLDFVTENQLKILGRKNLNKEEVKMLQIRSMRTKYDKLTGALNGNCVNLSVDKFAWDGIGGKYQRDVTVCDHSGASIPNGAVSPGDVVAATMYANRVYTGLAGDKFGIHWAFQDVSIICQRGKLEQKTEVNAFVGADWPFAKAYVDQVSEQNATYDASAQFETG